MNLGPEDIQSLVWASAALSSDAKTDYDASLVEKMVAMSEVRHRMLDYHIELDVMPKQVADVDRAKNAELLPETDRERIYGIKSVTHQSLSFTVDEECAQQITISADGQIIIKS